MRTYDPPLEAAHGQRVTAVRAVGKRIAMGLEEDLWLVLHLMIAGRLHWKKPGAKPPGKRGLAAFDFPEGTLILTEAGARKRASLHVLRGARSLADMDPGGIDVMSSTAEPVLAGFVRLAAEGLGMLRSGEQPTCWFEEVGARLLRGVGLRPTGCFRRY